MNTAIPSFEYKPSRYNIVAWSGSDPGMGDILIYNSFSSGFVRLTQPAAGIVEDMLSRSSVPQGTPGARELAGLGILIDAAIDELAAVEQLQEQYQLTEHSLNLILMPTEKCIFRCLYCYEDFAKGRMSDVVMRGVVGLVAKRAAQLQRLRIDWFGGEPLSALPVVERISKEIIEVCSDNGINYSATMTTNGFLLTRETADLCLGLNIRRYQITLDGTAETHNKLRVLQNGRPTFDTIVENLMHLSERKDDFSVRIRVNFTPALVAHIPQFLRYMGERFGNDRRFTIWFHPVGRWGGPHDDEIEICDKRAAENFELEFMQTAAENGFQMEAWRQAMQPFGSVCYAADPKSFVIGSDGSVYKCTVALKDPRNLVGALSEHGDIALNQERMSLWTKTGAESDRTCYSCSFRPACQGNACPAERMRLNGDHACPPIKKNIHRVLPLLAGMETSRRTNGE
ncbi:SPASM domain-containing protein [Nocardia amamiensis]|uniref:SPASM domain-containing protein n=1 Tax=Nocardia amamiensis TaxID=404578 RepID=A0ABS0CVS6_9NOCA|nr:radical SAM protein [Nocardia amamiensis]MBF6300431.1 SPASM domain-containing protein [Nocardia amamiensis]